ncbi:MAG: TackOD1 domain-containing metal-binding protein [Candidatus Hodarchaeales archaeon]|jgi:DNA-binding Lrp family transcriptional regulator
MPKAMFAIWWDDKLGPFIGRTYPEGETLSGEEALIIFMGHGVKQEAKVGYTKLPIGLIVSYMEPPNCIAVLLDENDDSAVVERNLLRLIPHINFSSDTWDNEIKKAYDGLIELIQETSGESLLSAPKIHRLIHDMDAGRVGIIKPRHVLSSIDKYPEAAEYLGQSPEEVVRILEDLEKESVIFPKTYGRRIECRQCGSSEVTVTLLCPKCESDDLYKVYTMFCPFCSDQFQTVLVDELREVRCQKCHDPVKVADLSVVDVEPLCNACGTASNDPKIVLTCAVCNKQLQAADLLAGTGLAYYPEEDE